MPADPRRVKDLFYAALDRADPEGRRELLDRECRDDPDLRLRLDALLAAHDRPAPALDPPLALTPGPDPTADYPAPAEDAGTLVPGRSRLLRPPRAGGP